jgi:hypothetical protein
MNINTSFTIPSAKHAYSLYAVNSLVNSEIRGKTSSSIKVNMCVYPSKQQYLEYENIWNLWDIYNLCNKNQALEIF